jgi:hypothetical protein
MGCNLGGGAGGAGGLPHLSVSQHFLQGGGKLDLSTYLDRSGVGGHLGIFVLRIYFVESTIG